MTDVRPGSVHVMAEGVGEEVESSIWLWPVVYWLLVILAALVYKGVACKVRRRKRASLAPRLDHTPSEVGLQLTALLMGGLCAVFAATGTLHALQTVL